MSRRVENLDLIIGTYSGTYGIDHDCIDFYFTFLDQLFRFPSGSDSGFRDGFL